MSKTQFQPNRRLLLQASVAAALAFSVPARGPSGATGAIGGAGAKQGEISPVMRTVAEALPPFPSLMA